MKGGGRRVLDAGCLMLGVWGGRRRAEDGRGREDGGFGSRTSTSTSRRGGRTEG
jgi:hypothetical protein